MELQIYQINTDRDTNRVAFMGRESTAKFSHSDRINCSIYDRVYSGNIDANSLEEVYTIFNKNHPDDYVGHSLSVSDIVEIVSSDNTQLHPGFYFCDSIGFQPVTFDPAECKDRFLPPYCFGTLPSTGEVIKITRFETGYTPLKSYPLRDAEHSIDALNEAIGVTKAQAAAMIAGSMFGWNCTAADPLQYSANGQPDKPCQKRVIGRIDYLSFNGRVSESVDYTDAKQFKKDIKKENYYGVPMSITLYKDKSGTVIPHDFIFELDPPVQGFNITEAPDGKNEITQKKGDTELEL